MNKQQKDIIISSRIRLARNVAGLPFPAFLGAAQAQKTVREVFSALKGKGGFSLYPVANMDALDGQIMKEKHLISKDLLFNESGGAVIVNESETISVMVNEEDHIRIQCILGGCNFTEAYKIADMIDDDIAKKVPYAFDPRFGYLTKCPTNLGTGMRASAMMFLPGLAMTGNLEAAFRAISRLNMTIRGVYGEGTDSAGYLYQVSNQRTLGMTEQDIVDAVGMCVGHVEDEERKAREILFKSRGSGFIDGIMRAYGILTNAYKLTDDEFMQLIALVKLGIYYRLLSVSEPEALEKLITDAQPFGLQSRSQKKSGTEEGDIFRASFVSKVLQQMIKRN